MKNDIIYLGVETIRAALALCSVALLYACGGGGGGSGANASNAVQPVAPQSAEPTELVVFADGMAGPTWDLGFGAYDQAIDYATCDGDDGAGCPSISWAIISDDERGQVLEISRIANDLDAGFFVKASAPYDAVEFAGGTIEFDIQIISGDSDISVKIDCVYPCTSGAFDLGPVSDNGWQTLQVNVDDLVAQDLNLASIDTGLVIWPAARGETVFRLDRVRWVSNPNNTSTITQPEPSDIWVNPNFEGPVSPMTYPGYSLYWSDEFTGDDLNTDYWNYEVGTGSNGWGNNELQYYRQENTLVAEGLLIIEARQQQFGGREYTSSRLTTQNKMSFTFGRVDIRAALPRGQGLWPALWSLGESFGTVGWPGDGEIDIMNDRWQWSRGYGSRHCPLAGQRWLKAGSRRCLYLVKQSDAGRRLSCIQSHLDTAITVLVHRRRSVPLHDAGRIRRLECVPKSVFPDL